MGKLAEAVNVIQTLCQAPAVEYPIKKRHLMCGTEVTMSKLGQRS